MFKKIFTFTLLAASSALADGPAPVAVAPAPIMASVTNWSGFYAGGMVSYDSGDHEYNDIPTQYEFVPAASYGAFAGYNFQNGSFVYGGEVAYSTADAELSGFPGEEFTYLADAKARVGYVAGNALIYGVVGGTMGNYTYPSGTNWDVTGFNYGAGVDYLISPSMFVGLEYLIRDVSGDTNNPGQVSTSIVHSAQLRVGYKF